MTETSDYLETMLSDAVANVSLPGDRGIYWGELAEMEDVAHAYLTEHPDASQDEITEACQEWINQPERGRLPETDRKDH